MTPRKKPDVWPGMTDEQHEALLRYIRNTADAMGLGQWQINLSDEPAENDALAAVVCTYGRLHATVSVCKDWFDQTLEQRRHAVVHELVHLHLDRVEQPFRDEGEEHLAPAVYSVLLNATHTNMEFAVDEIARVIVKFSDDREIVHLLEGRLTA